MDRREQVLYEELDKNSQETEKWTLYRDDHKQAEENLKTFGRSLEVEVMVPIGSKALMPGRLVHTNEVFLSHFRGVFSKCSAFQAQKIINHRLGIADKHLQELKTERDLFENKLWLPHMDGIIPNDGEQEIVEEYDEEKEKIWREKHRQSIREQKLREKEERSAITEESTASDVMTMLEELELMEELEEFESQLDNMNEADDDLLRKLMTGEEKIQEKPRQAHSNSHTNNDAKDEIPPTNNNSIPNNVDFYADVSDTSDTSSIADTPPEVLEMEKETAKMSQKEKIDFFLKQIENYEKKITTMRVTDVNGINEKMNYIEIREYLIDLIEILQDEISDDEIALAAEVSVEPKKKTTKRISFAEKDQIKYINKHECVSDMFKTPKRDVVKLDLDLKPEIALPPVVVDKKQLILDRVKKNVELSKETQSHSDFNLVDKILSSENLKSRTLQITFKHSESKPDVVPSDSNDIVGSPLDIYRKFIDVEDVPPTVNEENTPRSPSLKETDRNAAYKDIRSDYSLPNRLEARDDVVLKESNATKSILKKTTQSATQGVENTNPESANKIQKKKKKPARDEITCPFDLIMGDVVENPLTEPEPLPKENFIDALTPKKRISRFKQERALSGK